MHERTCTEYVFMKSSVSQHYGCKRTRHCDLIANRCSLANLFFLGKKYWLLHHLLRSNETTLLHVLVTIMFNFATPTSLHDATFCPSSALKRSLLFRVWMVLEMVYSWEACLGFWVKGHSNRQSAICLCAGGILKISDLTVHTQMACVCSCPLQIWQACTEKLEVGQLHSVLRYAQGSDRHVPGTRHQHERQYPSQLWGLHVYGSPE